MDIESDKMLESVSVSSNGEYMSYDGPVQFWKGSVQDNDQLSKILNDFESYWQDINDRLIISRVVSDSVIKGMVSAKEIEVTELKEQLLEGKMMQQLQAEVEVIVMRNSIQSVRGEYKRGTVNYQSCFGKTMQDKLKVVSSLCQGLGSVHKSLFNTEKLSSHGSLEIDHSHCRVLTKYGSPSSLSEANSRHKDCSSANLPENFESSRLTHLTVDELYSHFREVITELKRDHETTVQYIIEEYFSLKREFLKERELLKERGLFIPLKSKEFDTLKKTIPDIISKLNGILSENEDSSRTCDHLRDKLENLIAENLNLRDLLNNKTMEIKCLSSHVSEIEEKLTKHILDEAGRSETIEDLKSSLEDANMKASISEDVCNCIMRELVTGIKLAEEENLRSSIMKDTLAIVFKEAIHEAEAKMRLEYGELSNIQAVTLQDAFEIIFQEVLRGMEVQLKSLKKTCLLKDELIASLESEASDVERYLVLEAQEKHKLKQQILELEAVIEEKDKILIKEREHFEKALYKMKDLTKQQEGLISQRNTELGKLKANLEDSSQKIGKYEDQMDKLTKALESVQVDSKRTLEERDNTCLLLEAKDRQYREQITSAVHVIQQMTKAFENFELRTIENMKWNNVRLENSAYQLGLLVKKVNVLRRTGLLYKQRLERRCNDLQKAEAEVDILGDEVETLLGLLEKIYIALDHYEPVLLHYPGIMDILKLVERKLRSEYAKSISDTP